VAERNALPSLIAHQSSANTGTNPHLADTDNDGLSDFVGTGLDPTSDSTTAINLLPSTGGGLSEQDLIDLRVGSKLASIANDQATLQVVIEQSNDLGSWSTLQTEDVTVDAPAGTDKQFFRYRMQDAGLEPIKQVCLISTLRLRPEVFFGLQKATRQASYQIL